MLSNQLPREQRTGRRKEQPANSHATLGAPCNPGWDSHSSEFHSPGQKAPGGPAERHQPRWQVLLVRGKTQARAAPHWGARGLWARATSSGGCREGARPTVGVSQRSLTEPRPPR